MNEYGGGHIETALGDCAQTRILRFLSTQSSAVNQPTTGNQIGLSQSRVSRTKGPLMKYGLIESTEEGLKITERGRNVVELIEQGEGAV